MVDKCVLPARKFEKATRKPFGYLKARILESFSLRKEILQISKGVSATQDVKIEDDHLSDTFEDDMSVSSEEDIADRTKSHLVCLKILRYTTTSKHVGIAN